MLVDPLGFTTVMSIWPLSQNYVLTPGNAKGAWAVGPDLKTLGFTAVITHTLQSKIKS